MPIKCAIIGYGRNGSTMHAGPIEKNPDFELCAVCDIDPRALEKAKARFGCAVYTDYHEMLKREQLDFVVVVTRSSQHAEMAADCLLAGVNTMVTKPWATTVDEARLMISAQKVSGKLLLPWLPARWGSDLAALREIVARGDIGKIWRIHRAVYSPGKRCDWQTQREFGGGYLLNWGPHLVDQPLRLAGSPVVSVYGELRQIVNPGDAEDNVFVMCKTEAGITTISEYSTAVDKLPNWVIQGDGGTIFVRGNKIEINRVIYPEQVDGGEYRSDFKKETEEVTVGGNIYGDEYEIYRHIARVLHGEEQYFASPEDALELSRVLDAARMSSRLGQAVYLR